MKQIFLVFCLLFAINTNILIANDDLSQSENIDLDDEELNDEIENIIGNAANAIKSSVQSGNGCLCASQMTAFITIATDLITKPLKEQMSSLKKLKKTIKQHNKTMNEQNIQLDKKLNLLKEETVRNREMLFYLKQKNNLQ